MQLIQTIVVACMASACPMQFDDQKGHFEGPHAVHQCQLRGAEIIYQLIMKEPLFSAQTLCVTVKQEKSDPTENDAPKLETGI